MKLSDHKEKIDKYFNNASAKEILKRFEKLGYLFEDTKPLTGDLLQHLSDFFDKTAIDKPTLPNRL